jgi:hypothetical protein
MAHPKTVRRRILIILYERYLRDPLDMLTPQDILETRAVSREDLIANVHYLNDKGLIELMMGYNPPLFAAVRITAKGIDLVENTFEFNLQFPPEPGEAEHLMAGVPLLIERLVAEADFSALDGEERKCLLRDVQYLRDELMRRPDRWRMNVIETVIGWIAGYFDDPDECPPSLGALREAIAAKHE